MTTITDPTPIQSTPAVPATTAATGTRLAAAGGVAFVVLSVASTFAAGAPPASDASAAKVAAYFHDHSGGIRSQLLLGGLGIAALVWWFGALWRMLSRAEHEQPRLAIVAAVGLAIGGALALVNGIAVATAAIRPTDAATTRLLFTLSLIAISAAGFGLGTFLLATSTVTYRAHLTPGWVSGLGVVAALAFFVSAGGAVSDAQAYAVAGLAAFFVWCAWILAVSVTMWRSAGTEAG
jgi:hypothetical protein